jgi:hypothetical protein
MTWVLVLKDLNRHYWCSLLGHKIYYLILIQNIMPKLTHLLKACVMSKSGRQMQDRNANERSGKPDTTKQCEMSIQEIESTNK